MPILPFVAPFFFKAAKKPVKNFYFPISLGAEGDHVT